VVNPSGLFDPSVLTAEDVSALVIPDGCVGLPTLAAVEQGIPVVAVRNNTNLMRNDLRALPFRPGQLQYAQNYYEAAGILAAMKAGVAPAALARPMQPIRIERSGAHVAGEAPATNGKLNGHTNGNGNGQANGSSNGNGKSRRSKSAPASVAVTVGEVMPELLVEVGGE
jgi:hypothetical protein